MISVKQFLNSCLLDLKSQLSYPSHWPFIFISYPVSFHWIFVNVFFQVLIARTSMICVNSGREIIFAREEMIPWINSPCKEFAPDRVKSASDDEKYTGKCINLYLKFITCLEPWMLVLVSFASHTGYELTHLVHIWLSICNYYFPCFLFFSFYFFCQILPHHKMGTGEENWGLKFSFHAENINIRKVARIHIHSLTRSENPYICRHS